MRIVALAGGVGGARLVDGLARLMPPDDLSVVVNTGDDFEHLGLHISPDLDTICYTLAQISNPQTGWGRADETWNMLQDLGVLGGPTWFKIGDRDLATHLERTRRLSGGDSLSGVTRQFCRSWGIRQHVLPMTDGRYRTIVETSSGDLDFQEYFVHQHCEPRVQGFRYDGAENCRPSDGVVKCLIDADAIVICPSNPWVSIGPILAVPGIRHLVSTKPTVAISPIIRGQAVKGPAAKMYGELGIDPSASAVARQYKGIVCGFVLDLEDRDLAPEIERLGMRTLVTHTVMPTLAERIELARSVLDFVGGLTR